MKKRRKQKKIEQIQSMDERMLTGVLFLDGNTAF